MNTIKTENQHKRKSQKNETKRKTQTTRNK